MKKKIIYILLTICCLFIILGLVLIFNNYNQDDLEKLGYSNLEIKEINKLTESEIDIIKNSEYNKNLIYVISSNNYNSNKLNMYIKYLNKYEDIDYIKIMNLINNDDFIEDNIGLYTDLIRKYDNLEGIINYVNDYQDYNIEINDVILEFISQQYFIVDYLDRYINYYNNNSNLEFSEIVTRINSNLDYTFYKNSNKADLSKGMYTLVNKFYYLDKDYIPEDISYEESEFNPYGRPLNKVALENYNIMANEAKKEGLTLKITTGYRDYNFQSTLYNNYIKVDGIELADTYSARPGYSEHQLGYSADVTNKDNVSFDEFENTEEFKWLNENAYKYGFILRYPKDKEYITGYQFEAWHYRYVGIEIATYIYENNITYEEYYAYFLR